MKIKNFLYFILFIIYSCEKKPFITNSSNCITISNRLHINDFDNRIELISENKIIRISKKKLPFKRIVFLNSSLIGYVLHLGMEKNIIGITSPEYIYSDKITTAVQNGQIKNVGNEQKYDIEQIIALKPDVIFTNYIPNFENTYKILGKNGISIIFLDEYLEQNPMQKAAYLKIFGKLLGVEEKANEAYYTIAKNYVNLRALAHQSRKKSRVMLNEMYGDKWFMPGGETSAANYIKDANARYILGNNTDKRAIPMTFEEVFSLTGNVNYWVNIGNYKSKNDLLRSNINYGKLPVFQSGNIYSIAYRERNKANDLFESGAVRADLVLRDYIKIFHSELINDSLYYMREIK